MLNLGLIEFLHHLILDQSRCRAATSKKNLQQQTCVKLNMLDEDFNLKINLSSR